MQDGRPGSRGAQARSERADTEPASAQGVRFQAVRRRSLELARPLSAEDCQVQSMPDTSPVKWHLAHITWFWETFVLERFERDFRAFERVFRGLYTRNNTGVGALAPRPHRGSVSRPSLETVVRYRADVDARMGELLALRGGEPEIASLVEIGLHHEQQHQELILTDVKHALSFSPLDSAYAKRWPMASVGPQPVRWFDHAGGLVELGHDPALDGPFAFDNETPRHRTFARPFSIASRPATYGDFLAFMEDGGYERPELWLSLGWDWVQAGRRAAPLYWSRDPEGDGGWLQHTLQGTVAADPNTPICHLSYFEADAFARWSDARLPTELEWELAARASGVPPTHGNFADRGAFHPMPQQGPAVDTPVQLWGDVWEWTQSAYAPYPGFRPAEGAVGEYNGKFMCSQLVLRGGSCATPAGHVRASYRNFFPPEAQWQFSGVRLARDL